MNIRTVRKKIKAVRNVRKITKAMQMVSAVKMKKAQQLEIESKPYRTGLRELMFEIAQKLSNTERNFLHVDTGKAQKELAVVVSSNKGLAGSFNSSIFRSTLKHITDLSTTDLVTVGSKGSQFFGRIKGTTILADFSGNNLIIEASALFDFILSQYKTGTYKKIYIIYSKFISPIKSEIETQVLLPIQEITLDIHADEKQKEMKGKELIIEPSPDVILEQLILSFIENNVRGAIISSEAVEHSARMMAMKSATDNASELIEAMTLRANRLRQEKITNELLDMITAKESVGK